MGNRQTLAMLRKSDVVLMGKNSPAILFRHARWHLVSLGFVAGPRMGMHKGISAVNFMSPYRARKTIHEWLPYCAIVPFAEVSDIFRQEVECKILACAEDYRFLLKGGWVVVAGGFTTDTLHSLSPAAVSEDALVAAVDAMMRKGETGPFLHFERSYKVIQTELA